MKYIYIVINQIQNTHKHTSRGAIYIYVYMAVGYGNGAGFPEYLPNPTPNGKGLG